MDSQKFGLEFLYGTRDIIKMQFNSDLTSGRGYVPS